MPEIGNLEDKLLEEIHGMREDFRRVSVEIAQLATEVRHLTENQLETKGHGERLAKAEEKISAIEGRLQSADTERRWIVGVLVAGAISVVVTLISVFFKH